jgi:PAS domain S-box-containing protein
MNRLIGRLGILRTLVTAAAILPPLGFGLLAWQTHQEVWTNTGRDLQRSVQALNEYMLRVLHAQQVLGELVNVQLRELDDAGIRAQERRWHDTLKVLSDTTDHVNNIGVFDAAGRLLAATFAYPVPPDMTFADREWMQPLAAPDAPAIHISHVMRGRVDGGLFFAASRRRDAPGANGGFAGVITIALDPVAIAAGLSQLAGDRADRVAIWREDAVLLVRHPPLSEPPPRLAISPPIRTAMAAGQAGPSPPVRSRGASDGQDRLNVVQRLGRTPLYVAVGREVAVIEATWRQRVGRQLAVGVPAWLGLVALGMAGLSRARQAQAAQAALADEAIRRATAEATARGEARFRGVFESEAIGMAIFSLATARVVDVNDRALAMVGQSREDYLRRGLAWREATPAEWLALDDAALADGQARGFWAAYEKEYVHHDGRRVGVRISSAPLPGEPGHVVVIIEDITSQREAEARRDLFMHEVEHRARNTLSLVQVIMRSSLTALADAGDVAGLVEGRIAALARSQALLARADWQSAPLADIVRGELALADDGARAKRVVLNGPPLVLHADAVQPLSMTLHELMTNAMKYGALSSPQGRLEVSWQHDRTGQCLRLRWSETGGPPLPGQPDAAGFGSKLLQASITLQLRGTVGKTWRPEGLLCEIAIPDQHLLPSVAAATAA